jgi:phosphatidylethanolamine/phosphatidyl-N-methylethanolamine N-methyltransferase
MSTKLNNFRYFFFTPIYDVALQWFYRPLVQQLIAAVNAQHGERVLEIGVGTGISLPYYNAQCKQVTAIDCSLPMLETARKKASRTPALRLSLEHAAAEDFESQAGQFDQIVFCNSLSVMQQPARVLAAYYELLPVGGSIYLLNHFTPESGILRQLDKLLTPVGTLLGFKNFFPLQHLIDSQNMVQISTLLHGYWRIVQITKVGAAA